MLILQLLLFLTLLIVMFIFNKNRKKLKLPPGPWQLPFLGYLPFINAKSPHLTLTALAKQYGSIFGINMGSVYAVVLSDHNIIRQVLAKEEFSGRAPLYLTHGIMKGYGLICAEGESWKEQRKFAIKCLKDFGIVKYSCIKRDKLEERILTSVNQVILKLQDQGCSEDGIDPFHILHHCLGNFINDLVFGITYDENDETWMKLQKLQEEGLKYIGVAGPLNFLPFLRHLPRYKNMMKFVTDGQKETHRIYQKLIEKHEKDPTTLDHFLAAFTSEMKKRMMTSEISSFADPQIYYLLADMYGAGVDTTLTTLRWFLLFIALHFKEQEEIQKELDAVIGDRRLTLNDSSSLPRLEAAIAETQRIRSIVPLGFPHGSIKDSKICGYDIPKGSMIIPLQWAVHMDSRFWSEPEKFKPERFLAEDGSLAKPEAFLPFQSGKRMCVGDELARMILLFFTAHILQSFTLSTPADILPDTEGDCGITLSPKPHHLIFTPRSGRTKA
ncbi:cytochrome P450 306a1 isoform X2 [Leptopilina boulardi]|uniref:cytochrome P450 306a1 isoform X2 n=1 Tax=Leptopilina boulardi TaxID=63433 RepID=UPI0021F69208|nr:cytochrome P450 306a1 isoform X2 [Leptopilina boulardi]